MTDEDKIEETPAPESSETAPTADASAAPSDSEPTSTPSDTESAEKPKVARKPRGTKKADAEQGEAETADEVAAEAATDEVVEAEDEVVAATEAPAEKPKRSRAAKPKAEAAEAPKAEKAKPASAAKPKAAPKRGAAKRPEQPVAAQVVRAQAKYVRSSARKARLVCDNIRGKSVTDARAILAHTPRAVARDWSKLLESAVANAENNHDLDGEDLVIKAVHADEGPTIKRFRPRAMGRATKIRKRTAHLTILLTPKN
jgi:ribosomal protein L22